MSNSLSITLRQKADCLLEVETFRNDLGIDF